MIKIIIIKINLSKRTRNSLFILYIFFIFSKTIIGDNMIEYYETRKIDNEQVLILYLDYNYEFSSVLKGNTLLDRINNFIRVSKINWNGTKVIFVVGGLVLGTLALGKINKQENIEKFDYVSNVIINHYDENNNDLGYSQIEIKPPSINEKKENIKEEIKVENNVTSNPINTPNQEIGQPTPPNEAITMPAPEEIKTYVTIYRSNGKVETIELEEYIIGVVSSEMPAAFHIEALKAQSIASRTYALKSIQEGKILTDNEKTQSYKDIDELKEFWKDNFDTYYRKIKHAVETTKGQVILYNNEYIEAIYHSTSNGYTENSYEVFGYNHPYLISVNSSWDINATSFLREKTLTFQELSNLLGIDFNNNTLIEILERNSSGRISRIKISDNYYTGIELRMLLGLRSTDFDITINHDNVIFTTRGYGHGVGMSQYGANGMANNGKTYVEILKHYYPGTTIKTVN